MKPYEHQVSIAKQAFDILKVNGIVYLAMEERTGKTLTSILTVEHSKVVQRVLVITKKKALDGWFDTLAKYKTDKLFDVVNYHQIDKKNPKSYDLIIIDEAHAYLSKYPKVGEIHKSVAKFTKGKPIIYLSATPSAQGYSLLFHQFSLSDWSPWRHYSNFYKWFEVYGVPRTRFIGGKQFKEYNTTKEDLVKKDVDHLFISYSRVDLGFKHEPNDVIHFVELEQKTKLLYKDLENSSIININGLEVVAETPMSLLTKLHQIEGGTIKYEEESLTIGNKEKIDYILNTWGDSEDLVIFYHYKQEEKLLKNFFTKAQILQASSFAEGVDLSMYEHLVIYSMNFSTSQYTQRRARQANMQRDTIINVNFLLVKGGISEQVYTTVAVNKSNFVDKYYTRGLI